MARVVPTIGQAIPGNFDTAAFWNSNVQALGQFLLNVPRFSGSLAGTQTLTTNGTTFTSVLIDTETEDTDNGHNTASNSQRYTCQVAGLYLVTGSVCFANNTTGFRAAKLQVNGTTDVVGSENICLPITSGSLPTVVPVVPSYVRMNVGDYVVMQAIQNSGGNLTLTTVGASQTVFAAQWVAA